MGRCCGTFGDQLLDRNTSIIVGLHKNVSSADRLPSPEKYMEDAIALVAAEPEFECSMRPILFEDESYRCVPYRIPQVLSLSLQADCMCSIEFCI